jgi:hypothetical protein
MPLYRRKLIAPPRGLKHRVWADCADHVERWIEYVTGVLDRGLPVGVGGEAGDTAPEPIRVVPTDVGDPTLGSATAKHVHGVVTDIPVTTGVANFEGISEALARADHVHRVDHGGTDGLGDDDHPQYQLRSEEGMANGYASLDAGALVPTGQLGTGVASPTTVLAGDQTWKSLGSLGVPTMAEVELDFGTPAVVEKVFTVIDPACTPASRIIMNQSGAAATGRDADEAEFDAIDCRCQPLAGSFRVYATSLLGSVLGKYKFNYVLA